MRLVPQPVRRAVAAVLGFALAGCGGGTTPSAPPSALPTTVGGPRTTTFTGTSQIRMGVCGAPRHLFDAANGAASITLVAASDSGVAVQVCAPTAVNHATECSVPPFLALAVGQAVSITLKNGRAQGLTVYPQECGRPGAPADTPALTYTVTVTYPG